ncbi:MAG: hypothetical protein IJT02_09650 [Synergistaceae bacterium]|nr:hypothetical protein [Synergistaceae bacterium]
MELLQDLFGLVISGGKGLFGLSKRLLNVVMRVLNIGDANSFTCPYCMQKYNRSEIRHICPDCGTEAHPGRFTTKSVKCANPNCGGTATLRVCPVESCKAVLPPEVLDTKNLPFSIVGMISSGKTNYITVMLEELSRFHGIPLSLAAADQRTLQIHEKNRNTVYKGYPVEGNAGGSIITQIWMIKNLSQRRGSTVPAYTFTIFDGAGENYEQNLSPSSPVCRNIRASKAIILTLDPLILPKVREIVSDEARIASLGGTDSEAKNPVNIVNDMARYLRSAYDISTDKLLNVPVAVVLTKFDIVLNHPSFANGATVKSTSLLTDSYGHVNEGEFAAVDREIRDWLMLIGERAFITALEANFKDMRFFGVSSFGSAPDARNYIADIRPHRVLDPVMWLFKRSGFVD